MKKMMREMIIAAVVAGAGAVMGGTPSTGGATSRPATGPAAAAPAWAAPAAQLPGATLVNRDPVAISRVLGTVYKREADGFRLAPPAGSRLIERAQLNLISFIVEAKSWGGALQRVTDTAGDLKEYVATHRKAIVEDWSFRGVQFLEEKSLRHGNFPAVRLMFSVEVTPATQPGKPGAPVSLLRQELIVQVKERQFMVLTFYTPLRDKAEAIQTFDLMIPEFEIFDASTRERRVAAGALGKTWLEGLSAEKFQAKIVNEAQYFRILVGGEDLGYLRFDEIAQEPGRNGSLAAVERDGRKGILLQANVRSFPSNGSVVYAQNEAFWAFSKDASNRGLQDYFSWHNISKTKALIPVSAGRSGTPSVKQVTPWLEEVGVVYQAGDATKAGKPHRLVVTLNGDESQPLTSAERNLERQLAGMGPDGVRFTPRALPGVDQIVPVEAPAPLPKILEYSWPRFVDLTKPSEMSFVVFDSSAKKPTLRNLIVTGQKETVTIDGKSITCYKCVDELDPISTTMWTDKDGRIQMMRTNDQSVLIPTTEAAMTAKWGKRLKDQ